MINFKVDDWVCAKCIGRVGTIINYDGSDFMLFPAGELKAKSVVVKPLGRLSFVVLKDSRNNFEVVIRADTVKQARKKFKVIFKSRAGYTLYAPVLSSVEHKKIVFKELK